MPTEVKFNHPYPVPVAFHLLVDSITHLDRAPSDAVLRQRGRFFRNRQTQIR